ncbi:hypothetical protein ATK30_4152 [Amycolatopsis echigonensis]|uniref:Uncharacterized protein n=1 Tax=Amycolatopsis echigonensis TaxID=2576905 RepID=A0A2N3WHG3_9PSEU|nr:hypothetical protein [Amycolatopsis niigatensis]PKV93310.1 hypothetical protein ATK30_4152 [Amycolatopsis niigatensis]
MSSAEAAVVGSAFDIERGLQQLIARGYRFVHQTDGSGEMQAVVGVRVHDNVVDVVRLNAEDDVEAARLPGNEQNIFAPTSTLWRSRGEASQVLGEVLALPERPPVTAAASANGCWIPGRGGRSKWLAAS